MIEKCQVFTPASNVRELLDAVGYTKNLYGKKVIENACGDGNIIKEIVKRYIEDSLSKHKSIDEIKLGLQRDIYGAEIDNEHYTKCISNLNDVAALFNIDNVKWNILNSDFLREDLKCRFDYVIGNPPYITYRDLDNETRIFLKEKFDSCKHGKFDYCYAFIEASLSCLKDTGKLAYLIPNSIFKNVFAKELRTLILPNIIKIIDYTTKKIFEKALTSSAIMVCDKGFISHTIEYQDIANNSSHIINKNLLGNKWVFLNSNEKKICKKRFGDYFSASVSIATLLNKVYILKDFTEEEDYIIVDGLKIERDIIREGVSPRSLKYNKSELIIFPYTYNKDNLIRYKCDEFEKGFPETTKYLKVYAEELSERKSDKSIEWFEYGRTQALAHLNQPKLLLSTVVTKKVKIYQLSRLCIPYSGIYIVPKKDLSLEKAKKILESESFYKYIQGIGINASGSSLRITSADINNFEFE